MTGFIDSELHHLALVGSFLAFAWKADTQELQFTFVSKQAERTLGYPPESWAAGPDFWLERIHSDDRERAVFSCLKAAEERAIQSFELRVIAADGSVVWTRVIVSAVMKDGFANEVVGVAIDVTEQKCAESTIHSLLAIGEKLNSTLDIDQLIDTLVAEVVELVEAEAGCVGIRTGQEMRCRRYLMGHRYIPLDYSFGPGEGLPGWLLLHKTPYLTNDAQSDTQIVPALRDRFEITSALAFPIMDSQGDLLGFLEVHNKRNGSGFTMQDQEKLKAVSHAAAVAIQNAVAYRDIQQAREDVSRLSGHLLQVRDEERQRIARNLHDNTAQNLASLIAQLSVLDRYVTLRARKARALLKECHRVAGECLSEIRTLSYLLHPPMLDETGLVDAVRHYVNGFTSRSGILVDVEVSGEIGDLHSKIELALFHVVQESLTNVLRHSGSYHAKILISREPEQLILEIADRGCGLSGDQRRPGLGIQIMRERVRHIGGRFALDSGSWGTSVRATIPMEGNDLGKSADPGRRRSRVGPTRRKDARLNATGMDDCR